MLLLHFLRTASSSDSSPLFIFLLYSITVKSHRGIRREANAIRGPACLPGVKLDLKRFARYLGALNAAHRSRVTRLRHYPIDAVKRELTTGSSVPVAGAVL